MNKCLNLVLIEIPTIYIIQKLQAPQLLKNISWKYKGSTWYLKFNLSYLYIKVYLVIVWIENTITDAAESPQKVASNGSSSNINKFANNSTASSLVSTLLYYNLKDTCIINLSSYLSLYAQSLVLSFKSYNLVTVFLPVLWNILVLFCFWT